MYRVELKPRAQRELDRLPRPYQERVLASFLKLAADPRPRQSVKLTGAIYRLRIGPLRAIYAVFDHDQLVLIGKITRREKDTYERLEELF